MYSTTRNSFLILFLTLRLNYDKMRIRIFGKEIDLLHEIVDQIFLKKDHKIHSYNNDHFVCCKQTENQKIKYFIEQLTSGKTGLSIVGDMNRPE